MSHHGDIRLGDTVDLKFSTRSFTTGVPTTLAGTPVISAYVGNSVTQITAGITLTVDFDGVTGLHNIRVVATSGNGYATASNYDLVITTGTVGGVSVVGEVVGSFSIEARSALMPTTAARTLDVSATGEAGLDWANIGSPTTAQNLGATNIDVDQIVASVSGAVGSVTGLTASNLDATVSSRMATYTQPTGFLAATFPAGTVANTTNITAGTITTATNLTTNNDKTGYGLSAAAVQAIWDALTSALTTVGSIGKKLADWVIGTTQTGDSFARLGAPAGASLAADVAAVKAETASVQADTNDIQARLPTALVGGRMDSNASAINNIATAAARLGRSTQGIVLGAVGAASTTTSIVTSSLDPAASVADQLKGRIVTFDQGTTTAALRGQSTDITANTAGGILTVTLLTTAPVSGDTFTIT